MTFFRKGFGYPGVASIWPALDARTAGLRPGGSDASVYGGSVPAGVRAGLRAALPVDVDLFRVAQAGLAVGGEPVEGAHGVPGLAVLVAR